MGTIKPSVNSARAWLHAAEVKKGLRLLYFLQIFPKVEKEQRNRRRGVPIYMLTVSRPAPRGAEEPPDVISCGLRRLTDPGSEFWLCHVSVYPGQDPSRL